MRISAFPRFLIGMLACLSPLLVTACARVAPPVPQEAPQAYKLGAGDALRIIVYGRADMSGEFTIDPSGRISLPLIQSVKAEGLTVQDLEKSITQALKPKYLKDPKVSIEVLKYRDVYVLGEVRQPGHYPYIPNMRGLQAIAVAGGHTYRAEEDTMEINRQTGSELKIYTDSIKSVIQPGDTVIVKRRLF